MSKVPDLGSRVELAPLFAALGDETRLELVARLRQGEPLSISDLSRGSLISRQAITKHLQVLASAGLVRDRREGREHLWELEIKRVDEARQYLEQISQQWDRALSRLRRLVEE